MCIPEKIRTIRLLQAELIVLLALSLALLSLYLLDSLGLLSIARDPRPMMLICAVALVGAAFAVSYFYELTALEHVIAMIPWLTLLYWLVSYGMGTAVPDMSFMSWFGTLSASLVLPWILGALWGTRVRNAYRNTSGRR